MSPVPEEVSGERERSEVKRVWNANAAFWDSRMGEGNSFHLQLLLPAIGRLLEARKGTRILDIACGNGQLSRWLSRQGANVVAVDVSEALIDIAVRHGNQGKGGIDYRVLDVSVPGSLESLGDKEFDAIVCNMALMDIPDLAPMASAIPHLLKPRGRFVFSTTHPCFNMSDMRRVARESEEGGHFRETFGIEIRRYLTPRTGLGFAMAGQPEPQLYFDRPLSLLLRTFLKTGLLIDTFEEPSFPQSSASHSERWFDWKNFPDIPPVIIVRFVIE